MKKYSLIFFLLFSNSIFAESDIGTRFKREFPKFVEQQCTNDLMDIKPYVEKFYERFDISEICTCVKDKTVPIFNKSNLEKDLNEGSITFNQFQSEIENMLRIPVRDCMSNMEVKNENK